MSWYPQFGTGSVAQFPLGRTRKWRAITNRLENDERVVLADAAANEIEWELRYQELSNAEVASLATLFTASQGGFGAFGFIDPTANLLGASGDMTQPDWSAGLLTVTSGAVDPLGASTAWTLANANLAAQALQQTLGVPSNYTACFSVWLYSSTHTTLTLTRDGITRTVTAGPRWTRAYVSGAESGGTGQSVFSVVVPAGQTIRVWGPQVEAQPYPSQYKVTAAATGIYEETYFRNDELTVTSTAPGVSSCDVMLISRG
jgi:hypothetical protein